MSTQAQIDANRANSRLSTGPKTEAGKATSSHNAVKSALTGRTILLPTDDVPAYQRLVQSMIDLHRPANHYEERLVQSLADTEWRLRRIPTIESGLYALGRHEHRDLFVDCPDPELYAAQLEACIFLKYERDLRNLSLQENRLRRMYEKDLAALRRAQAERKEKEEEQKAEQQKVQAIPASAGALFNEAKQAAAANPSLDISEIGFEFSNPPKTRKEAA